jgi:branched-chain amino acid transport system substrate-binding protein
MASYRANPRAGSGMSRREALRRLGAAGAALGASAWLAACGGGDDKESKATPAPAGGGATQAAGQATSAATQAAAAPTGRPISIGMMIPLSGVYAGLGNDMRDAFQLYLDEKKGGLGGRPVQLIVEDTEANPEVGLRKAQKLIRQDRVALATGIVSSAVALGVRDLFHEEQVPLAVSNAGANDLTRGRKSPYIFRTAFSNWQTCFCAGQWFYENVAKDGVFCIAPNYAAGKEDIAAFRESFEKAGGKVVGEVFPPFATTQDYQPFLTQIKNANAKAVFAFFSGGEAITFVKQYKEFGLKDSIPLVGPGFLTELDVLNAQGDAALGIRTTLHYSQQLENAANKSFVEAFKKKTSRPSTTFAVQSWDAAQLIDRALAATKGDSDAKALIKAMETIGEIDSPRGKWKMDEKTHNPIQNFYLREVKRVGADLDNAILKDLGPFPDPGA